VRGITNGDDAIIIGDSNFLAVDDGVGAWAQKERGHAALWSRLIAHFWAVEVEKSFEAGKPVDIADLNPIQSLQVAYELTKAATKGTLKEAGEEDEGQKETTTGAGAGSESPKSSSSDAKESKPGENDILGTTTASSALLHYKQNGSSGSSPVVLATTLGDCKVLIVRPSSRSVLYRSKEQWHWFDCPRQLGTNSPDTPVGNAVTDTVEVEVGDVVAVLSDGVTDNLWEHEICETITTCVEKWTAGDAEAVKDGVVYVARTLMNAAREIAQDPNAESPYMERAFDEGIAAEGGKLDDISVVIGVCRKRETE
jgi:serine/threonine protein phosphatase PrpC